MASLLTSLQGLDKKIQAKLVFLIENQLDALKNVLRKLDWDAKGTEGLDKPQDYMVDLAKSIVSFHKVLSSTLHRSTVATIFEQVFELLNTQVPLLFEHVNPKTVAGKLYDQYWLGDLPVQFGVIEYYTNHSSTGKAHVRVDLFHLLSKLRTLRGLSLGDQLDDWIKTKLG